MSISPLAGRLAEPALLVDIPKLVTAYYTEIPDPSVPAQRVAFGTSGHRGSAFDKAFNEWGHSLLISLIRPVNLASQRVAQRLGMTDRRHVQFHGFEHCVFEIAKQPQPPQPESKGRALSEAVDRARAGSKG